VLICFQMPAKALSAFALSAAEDALLGFFSCFLQPVYTSDVIASIAITVGELILFFIRE
jgi:hypothetical protein